MSGANVPDWMILAGALLTVGIQLLALIMGIARFKRWFEQGVVEPYIRPIRDDLGTMRREQAEDRKMLMEHDKYIYLLLGKQLGGIPTMETTITETRRVEK